MQQKEGDKYFVATPGTQLFIATKPDEKYKNHLQK